jgi:CheY-like chemotaxis protein
MPKKVLSIGQCGPDHACLSGFLQSEFDAEVEPAFLLDDALEKLRAKPFDLVLINRKLDADYSDGIGILESIKSVPDLCNIPVMVITNYPEHQQKAVAAGAVRGFGKLELKDPQTLERLRPFLADSVIQRQ